jgi:hypothetical protein
MIRDNLNSVHTADGSQLFMLAQSVGTGPQCEAHLG